MEWFRLDLLPGLGEDGDHSWQVAWSVAYEGQATDPGNALFRQSRSAAGKGAVLYFTPQAAELAETFGARRCAAPPPDSLCLIAGDERAWLLHFPAIPAGRVLRKPTFRRDDVPRADRNARHSPFAPTQPLPS